MRVDHLDRRDYRELLGELNCIGVIDLRQAFESDGAKQGQMDRKRERA